MMDLNSKPTEINKGTKQLPERFENAKSNTDEDNDSEVENYEEICVDQLGQF